MAGLVGEPPARPPFEVEPGPSGTRFAQLRRYEQVGSTNEELLAAARSGAPEGLVAVARHQTSGRGRLGRRWEAPPGSNLLFSVLLRPRLDVEEAHLVTVAVSLAASDACKVVSGVVPALKWPNDLVVGDRKLAGVLAELDLSGGNDPVVVVGMGLNVAWPAGASDEPEDLVGSATSLSRETGALFDPDAVLESLLVGFEERLAALRTPDGKRVQAEEHRRRCDTLGREVRVELARESIVGTAVDLTESGHLVVDSCGSRRTITAGDVVHLR